MTATSELLSVRRLGVSFLRHDQSGTIHRIPVLRELSISVASGEVVAVIGQSGAGKSILAHAILGLLPDNAEITGEIVFDGGSLTKQRLRQILGRELALVPQSVGFLDPTLRVKHAVRLAARRSGLSRSEATAAQSRVFERLGLDEGAAAAYPCELSGGMARRVLLAMALVSGARLLIADEPTPGLDPEALAESTAQLRAIANEGRAVLLITHDIVSALGIADRVAVLLDGAIVEVAAASAFSGAAASLMHPYSRALWNALPENAFAVPLASTEIQTEAEIEGSGVDSEPTSMSLAIAGQHA